MSISPPSTSVTYDTNRKRFRSPLRTPDPVMLLGEDGCVTGLNEAASRLLQDEGRALVGRPFFSLVHKKNLYRVMRDVADMVCYGKRSASWLLRVRSTKGTWRWCTVRARLLHATDNGKISLVLHEL